jgi:hypothetical protein
MERNYWNVPFVDFIFCIRVMSLEGCHFIPFAFLPHFVLVIKYKSKSVMPL